ncbi:restriction endonuclease [Halobacillus trueperi]|uniref:Restriction endonuclease n=1 Tax=Halobacillus trueperi TaxID=156205 RepID=A0A3D8VT87_9BACI|nr:restriction endonuclease [Halobacillus trueperi]RDY72586.1 restriction endonuclease [Halobacillus trueperi]
MFYFEIIVGLLLLVAFVHFQITKRKNDYQSTLLSRHLNSNEELKKTLAMGLYLRFRKLQPEDQKLSTSFIKQDPLSFEHFVADLLQKSKGGSTWVSPASGDFGVDIEHTTDEGLFLGQVKCYQEDLAFDPIALVHSNMIKRNAKGGYVITTGSFTSSAKTYAKNLNIELIDGVKLVELWIDGLDQVEQEVMTLLPKPN